VLTGRPPSEFSLPKNPSAALAPTIPPGLPAELLVRRPDIAEADRNVAATTAEIGIARAAYLPNISLTGWAGFESVAIGGLLGWQNMIASLAVSAVTPVFNGGRNRAGVDETTAAYRGSLAQYEKTVLVAYQDVEDQLAALRILSGEAQSEADAVADAKGAVEIATNRYKAGLVGYLDVLVAQTTLLANERVAAQISGQRMVGTVALVRALGGGWLGVDGGGASTP